MEPSGWRRKELICMILPAASLYAMESQYDAHKIQWQRSGQKLSLFCNYLNQCTRIYPMHTCKIRILYFLTVCIQTEISVCFDLVRPRRYFSSEAVGTVLWPKRLWCHYRHSHTTPRVRDGKNKTTFGFFRPFCVFLSELIFSKMPNSSHDVQKNEYNAGILVETKFFVRKGFFVRNLCIFFPVHPRIVVQKRLPVCSHICKVLKFILL